MHQVGELNFRMHLQRLDLNLLVALDALLTTQSVTRAAEQLCISQPAMSGALNRLREHFDDQLIERAGRNMVLTRFGHELAGRVSDLIRDTGHLVQLRPGFDPATSDRSFTIVASDYAMVVLMPLVLPRLATLAPHVVLRTETRAPDHPRRMAQGLVDLVLVPRGMADREFPEQPVFNDEYVCIAWNDNTQIGGALTREDFERLGHVVRVNPAAHAAGDEQAVRDHGIHRRIAATVPTFALLPRLVVGTQWIATVQRRLAEHAARHYPIRLLEPPFEMAPLVMTLQWPKLHNDDPGNAWLRDQLLKIGRELA